jgi:two-component sensor histidine kinase
MNFPRRMPLRSNSLAAWLFAACAVLAAIAVRFAFVGVLPTGVAFAAFIPAVILVTYFSGLWPAVASVAISAVAGWYLFMPEVSLRDFGDWALNFGPFLAICAVAIPIIHFFRMTLDELERERVKSAALAEQREVLFRELQHRVSNNLAIVSSLINLQRASVTDENARQALAEAATRLALIAKIQRRLHDPSGVQYQFGAFVEDLARDVLQASGAQNIVCLVSAADAKIDEEKLVPIALIVTELISNALEHGFAEREGGTIRIDLTPQSDRLMLTVADDGKGLPEGFSVETASSMGLRIVQALAQQINGRLTMENDHGAICRLEFVAEPSAA